ncbi:hypothetical protein BDK51DRAFT_30730, partial [Blyttiomyces helicus]
MSIPENKMGCPPARKSAKRIPPKGGAPPFKNRDRKRYQVQSLTSEEDIFQADISDEELWMKFWAQSLGAPGEIDHEDRLDSAPTHVHCCCNSPSHGTLPRPPQHPLMSSVTRLAQTSGYSFPKSPKLSRQGGKVLEQVLFELLVAHTTRTLSHGESVALEVNVLEQVTDDKGQCHAISGHYLGPKQKRRAVLRADILNPSDPATIGILRAQLRSEGPCCELMYQSGAILELGDAGANWDSEIVGAESEQSDGWCLCSVIDVMGVHLRPEIGMVGTSNTAKEFSLCWTPTCALWTAHRCAAAACSTATRVVVWRNGDTLRGAHEGLQSINMGQGSHEKLCMDTYYIAYHAGQCHCVSVWHSRAANFFLVIDSMMKPRSHYIQAVVVFCYVLKNFVGMELPEHLAELADDVRSEDMAGTHPVPPGAEPAAFVQQVEAFEKKILLWEQYPQQPNGYNCGPMALAAYGWGDNLLLVDGREEGRGTWAGIWCPNTAWRSARPDLLVALAKAVHETVAVMQVLFSEEGCEDVVSGYDCYT